MRILFALTVALGVASPNLSPSTTDMVQPRMQDPAPPLRKSARQSMPVLMTLQEIEGHVGRLVDLNSFATPVHAAARDDTADDALAVTVPIEQVCDALAEAASTHDLPVGFFARLIWQESRFDQWARSHAGALGVAQFMPPTAAEYGLHDPFDPISSVAASARFLRQLRDQFGNLGLAAAAYNAGGGRLRKWLNGQSGLPQETQNYVQAITGHPVKRWTVAKPLEVSFALPRRAPCDGVEGLSRTAGTATHDVKLTGHAMELIAEAEAAERARIAALRAARSKRHAAARATKGSRKAAATRVAATPKAKPRVRVAMATGR